MVAGIGEYRIEPHEPRPACRCVQHELAVSVENAAQAIADAYGLKWKGRQTSKITDDLSRLLGEYYVFTDCEPRTDQGRCSFTGQSES